jgi:FHS family L-fucose permease-like MFS transporter
MKTNKSNFAFASITMAFFMWGLLTSLNDVLIPHLKDLFTLNYAQVMLVQFAFFMAYAIIGIPAAKILHKIGYRWSISLGFLIAGLGCLGFLPAAKYGHCCRLIKS